jgi:hypothetical protein
LSSKSNPVNSGLYIARPNRHVVFSWCGEIIRSYAEENEEQMCLICHARMLNDYFQKVKRVSDERRAPRRFYIIPGISSKLFPSTFASGAFIRS